MRTIQRHPKMAAGIPVLDPIKEMKIDDPGLKDAMRKVRPDGFLTE